MVKSFGQSQRGPTPPPLPPQNIDIYIYINKYKINEWPERIAEKVFESSPRRD